MLDLISRGAQGHGPVHLLLISAAELGFAPGMGRNDDWASGVSIFTLRILDWTCAALPLCYSGCLASFSLF